MNGLPSIIVSSRDVERLESLLELVGTNGSDASRALEAELSRADIQEPGSIPPTVVTMNSRVLCVEEDTGKEHVVRLVYPRDANGPAGDVSVLAPVGAALLGLSIGQSIDWPVPGGRMVRIRVEKILYQPEAAGTLE